MSRFLEKKKDIPALNVASLPDLVFTVLFFFMIVTHMRQDDMKVHYQVPQGTEVEKVTKKQTIVNVYIGKPINDIGKPINGNAEATADNYKVQINGRLVTIPEIPSVITAERNKMPADERGNMTVNIRADRNVEMGLVNDVKAALQQCGALRINYSATKKEKH